MPVQWPYTYEEFTTTPVEIAPDADESLEIHNIFVQGGADNELMQIYPGRPLKYEFMVAPPRRNHLPAYEEGQDMLSLLHQAQQIAVESDYKQVSVPTIKVPEGEDFNLELNTDPDRVIVEYSVRVGDAAYNGTEPGGPQADTYLYVVYGNNSASSGTDDQWVNLDNSLMQPENDDFPFLADPKSPRQIVPLGLGLDSVVNVDTRADHLRILLNNEPQINENRNGVQCDVRDFNRLPFGGQSMERRLFDISWLPTIEEGDELLLQVQNNYDGANDLTANSVYTVFVGLVTPAGGGPGI